MSCTDPNKWFRPSDTLVERVRLSLQAERRTVPEDVVEALSAEGGPIAAVDQMLACPQLLRQFVADTALRAIGGIMLRSQTTLPTRITLGSDGRLADIFVEALAKRLPPELHRDEMFFAQLFNELRQAASREGGVDLDRGTLAADEQNLTIAMRSLQPTPPVTKALAEIEADTIP
jgi:hypothetical protein